MNNYRGETEVIHAGIAIIRELKYANKQRESTISGIT
jgi:hypothetical protein